MKSPTTIFRDRGPRAHQGIEYFLQGGEPHAQGIRLETSIEFSKVPEAASEAELAIEGEAH